MAVLPKLIYRSNTTLAGFLMEVGKLVLKFIWKFKGHKAIQGNSRQNSLDTEQSS